MTAIKKKHIDELHFEHTLWINQLKFYRDELKVYQKRLEEIASKNNKLEVRSQIESFQNKFIRQNEVIDTLIHNINSHESKLAEAAKANPTAIHRELFDNHDSHEDEINTFVKIYNELKTDYTKFSVEWM